MKLKFLGAAREVTGSCTLLETNGEKILVDCGMFQGTESSEEKNLKKFDFDPSSINALLLTHTHVDHSGLIPRLVREGFSGSIYLTIPTADLAELLLLDSAKIQESSLHKAEKRGDIKLFNSNEAKKQVQIYTKEDVLESINLFKSVTYNQRINVSKNIDVVFKNAGHILGASSLEVFVRENDKKIKVVFSGDIGNEYEKIVKPFDFLSSADYIVMESLYGGQVHENREETSQKLLNIINQTLSRGGNIIIPCFAVQRTQEILFEIKKFKEAGKMDNSVRVFLDSPLAISATRVYSSYPAFLNSTVREIVSKGENPYNFKNMITVHDVKQSMGLARKKGIIIIAGGGMCEGGRILYHLASNIEDSRSSIVFVGFQAENTLGRAILKMPDNILILEKKCKVRAKIFSLFGFSAHADNNGLLDWIQNFDKTRLKRVFLIHAEIEKSIIFQNELKNIGISSVIPKEKEEYCI